MFLVIDGKVVTPERGCLMGVTRQSILDLCEELGIPTEVRNIRKEELDAADEVGLMTSECLALSREKPLNANDCLFTQLLEGSCRSAGWMGSL